jgi:hypothetical protein
LHLNANYAPGGLTDVLTNHRHFEQEGFRAMFRS